MPCNINAVDRNTPLLHPYEFFTKVNYKVAYPSIIKEKKGKKVKKCIH